MHTLLSLLSLSVLSLSVLSIPHESLIAPLDRRIIGGVKTGKTHDDVPLSKTEIKCTSRSQDDRLLIAYELLIAKAIIQKGTTVHPSSRYYQAMFSRNRKDTPGFEVHVHQKYTNLASIYAENDKKVTITCDVSRCKPNQFATTLAAENNINLCPPWFDDAQKARTSTVASDCQLSSSKGHNWKSLDKYKATKSFTLVHEMSHLRYATGSLTQPPRAADYAYGVPNCKTLAEGNHFTTKCNPNPKGPPVQCPAGYSFQNADSLTFVPAGEYWSLRCHRLITVDNQDGSADPVDFDDEDADNP